MEFTDSPPRIPPTSSCFTDTTHRGDSLRLDFGEAHHLHSSPFHQHSLSSLSLHSDFNREILEKEMIRQMEKQRIREELINYEMARRSELMMQMKYSAPRMVDGLTLPSSSPQMMGFVASPVRHFPASWSEAFETKISPLLNRELQCKSRGTEVNPVSARDPGKQKLIVLGDMQNEKNIPGKKRTAESPPAPAAKGIDGLTFLSSSQQMMGFVTSPVRHVQASCSEAFEAKISPLLNRELQSESRGTEVDPVSARDPEKLKLVVLEDKQTDKKIPETKRTAESPPASAAEGIDASLTEKGWYCQVCSVRCNGKRTVSSHLRGRKHKSKEAALSAKNSNPTTEVSEPAAGSLRYSFWCEICKVGAHSEDVMTCHKEGRKHMYRLGRNEAKVSGAQSEDVMSRRKRGRKYMNRLGRNEAKVSVLVNNLAEWVDAGTQENNEVVD